jgi:WD40 repeat protein
MFVLCFFQRNELLRIQVPNLNCLCVAFMPDGKSIVSGWDDGKIRAFKPQSGALIYCISDAHLGGVTALACTSDCRAIVSGGEGGQVRVWAIERSVQRMLASMKEHKGRVNCIRINGDDSECVSASADGSCIVWSLQRFVRVACLFASTQFRSIVYHPDESQLVTTGTDRKLTFWDIADGNPIRILDGSLHHVLNTLAVSADGERFVTAGGDKQVKVFAYDEGVLGARGVGHSGEISQVVIAPDQRTIVSIGDEGAIFIWHFPHFDVDKQGNVVSPRAGGAEQYESGAFSDEEEEQLTQSFRSGANVSSPQQQQQKQQQQGAPRSAKASPQQQEEKTNGQSYRSNASAASAAAAAAPASASQRRTPGGAAGSSRRF